MDCFSALNYEKQSEYVLKLRAFDGQFTNERELTVKVEDVNDNKPEFDEDLYEVQIDSGIPVNSPFITVQATDKDSKKFGQIIYKLILDDWETFKINETSGAICSKKSLTQIRDNQLTSVTIEAQDGGSPPLKETVRVAIKVIANRQADESPVILPIDTVSVPENKKVNSGIFRVSAHFPDGSRSSYIKYQLVSGNEDSTFKLALEAEGNNYGALLMLAKELDRETKAKYELRVLAYDERRPSLNSTASFLVAVGDVNDIEPTFIGLPYRANVSINSTVGKAVIRVHAEDGDEGVNSLITYKIVSGDPNNYFKIDPETGWIELYQVLPFNVKDEIKLTVSASDPVFTTKANIYLTILNQNANAPVFPMNVFNFHKQEGAEDLYAFRLTALSGRQEHLDGIEYDIVDSEVQNVFEIDKYNGDVFFISSPDYEAAPDGGYTFHIRAKNSIGQSDIAVVNMIIQSVDEFPPYFEDTPYKFTVNADAETWTKVGEVHAFDNDRGPDGIVKYRFTKKYPNFKINERSGEIFINESLEDNRNWLPENTQSDSGLISMTPLLVEASSGKANSLHKIEAVEIVVDVACCAGLVAPAKSSEKSPVSGVILAVILVAIVVGLVVGGIAVLACVFHRTKNVGAHPPSVSGSPTHAESYQNGFMSVREGISPAHSTPSRNSSMHIYPNTLTMPNGGLIGFPQHSQRSAASSGRGSAMNDADSEIKRINDRNYLLNAKTPDFLAYQKDSGFNDMQDNVSVDSVAQNIAEVIFGEEDQHVYASASIESVHPFAEDIGRTGMSSLIYSKLQEIGADQFDPHKGFQGSFNSLVGHDLHENYNWDHLLNWNPQYHQLAQVFADIAKLKDDGEGSPGALPEPSPHLFANGNIANQPVSYTLTQQNQQPIMSPGSKKNSHPPFLTTMVQPGSQAVHPVAAYRQPNAGIVIGHPTSRAGYPMPPTSLGRSSNGSAVLNNIPTSYVNSNMNASTSIALTQKHPSQGFNQGQNMQQRNHKLSNGSLTGSTTSSNGSTKLPANHKSLSKQHHLAMGVNGAVAGNQRGRNGNNSRPYIREEQVWCDEGLDWTQLLWQPTTNYVEIIHC